jgi:branched-chain amino acid transport system ATP-binding protein
MAMLQIDGLEAFYGCFRALANVTLSVGTGEVVALIGSNGAGKTTTLRTISGLVHAARGRVSSPARM